MGSGESRNSSDILAKLGETIEVEGNFPIRASFLRRLETEVSQRQPNYQAISQLLLADPVLCSRILHILNSPNNRRSDEMLTMSQACEEIGLSTLLHLCQRMVVAQSFSALCRRSPNFTQILSQTILLSILTEGLMREWGEEPDERHTISGMLYGLGPLTLGYYYPQVYQAAAERAERRDLSVSQSIRQTLGIPPYGLSIGLVHFLNIPNYYRETISAAFNMYSNRRALDMIPPSESLARAVAAAGWMAEIFCNSPCSIDIEAALKEVRECFELSTASLTELLDSIPPAFTRHCRTNDLQFLSLPPRLEEVLFGEAAAQYGHSSNDSLTPYLERMSRTLSSTKSVPCVASYAMEALVYSMEFERAVIFFPDNSCKHLYGSLAIGKPFGLSPTLLARRVLASDSRGDPVQRSFANGTLCTSGEPMFKGAWPFAAIPIGQGDNTVGVIYADCATTKPQQSPRLERDTVRGLRLLTDSLHETVQAHL